MVLVNKLNILPLLLWVFCWYTKKMFHKGNSTYQIYKLSQIEGLYQGGRDYTSPQSFLKILSFWF